MVLYVMKWDILPDHRKAYEGWTDSAVERTVAAPGVVELRAYRPASGEAQVVVTYEFADLEAWAAWFSHDAVQTVFTELNTFTTNRSSELWGPSAVVPEPIRPKR